MTFCCMFHDSSTVERPSVKRRVLGSIPSRGAILLTMRGFMNKILFFSLLIISTTSVSMQVQETILSKEDTVITILHNDRDETRHLKDDILCNKRNRNMIKCCCTTTKDTVAIFGSLVAISISIAAFVISIT